MTEGKEKKKKASANATGGSGEQAQRVKDMTSGEMLRAGRLERKLGLEEVSAAIHIRVAQLRALEEGNIDALPGMTYALGFVRSYANFLKLNSSDVVAKFKLEHGAMKPAMPELNIPQAMPENRMPDPMIIGVAAFCAILLLVIWTIFSGGDEPKEVTADIPPAPVVEMAGTQPGGVSTITPVTETQPAAETPSSLAGTNLLSGTTAPVAVTPAPTAPAATAPVTETAAVETPVETAPAVQTASMPSPLQPGVLPRTRPEKQPAKPVVQPQPETQQQVASAAAPAPDVINIKRGKSRITLRATQSTWVQIDDARQKTVLKKLMKPGEQFFVPDEPGMSLVTTNAGGLDILLDGKKQPQIGDSGDIVRGVILEPGLLGKKRVRVNNY